MKSAHKIGSSFVAAAALFLMLGCEDKPSVSTTTEEATVHGKVTYKGKPLTKGQVSFDPANYQRKNVTARQADISADGTYTVKTLQGENAIHVLSPEIKGREGYEQLSLDVKSGDNTFDIAIGGAAAHTEGAAEPAKGEPEKK